MASL
ncbi:hypothetical protein D039_1130A, partial [Vibrio parahaemolyticus EKP-028]|jgi:hypothetical protein